MSKGYSGLFKGTDGETTYRKELIISAKNAVKNLISKTPNSKKKAMVAGAYDIKTGKVSASFAGQIPKQIHPELIKRAASIGGIGSHGVTERNTVGVCAEFHVVNNLLNSGSKIENIRLIPAIRPRTGTAMPFCDNCKKMFSDLIK